MVRGKFEYEEERARDLLRAYREVVASEKFIDLRAVVAKVVNSPAERFWVNEDIAVRHIRRMLKGERLGLAFACRVEMFEEILARTKELMATHPRWSIARAVRHVVHQPAPKFYLTAGSALEYLKQYRKCWQRGHWR